MAGVGRRFDEDNTGTWVVSECGSMTTVNVVGRKGGGLVKLHNGAGKTHGQFRDVLQAKRY